MHDLIIRGGTIVDGSGGPSYRGDIAVDDGRISQVGRVDGAAHEVIDAEGKIVTPGWVDIHTHFDGQITWDPTLSPSSWHGVTTVVMGNCGVGFAPARPDKHDWLISLMEGVEDIPGAALAEGIQWNWESFPEYLDYIDTVPKILDVCAQVPHGAVRAYVMGDRGARNEPATPDDIAQMAAIVKESIKAGAVGFSTSRTIVHRAIDGEPVPGTFAAEDELLGIGRALGELGTGVFEVAPAGVIGEDLAAPEKEMAWMRKVASEIGRPVTFAMLQHDMEPEAYRRLLDLSLEAAQDGARLYPQTHGRSPGILLSLKNRHPFLSSPSFVALSHLPFAEQVARLRQPEVRERLLAETTAPDAMMSFVKFDRLFALNDPPNYEPTPDQSVAAIAQREGRTALEVFYDLMLQRDGTQIFLHPLSNYSYFSFDVLREMLMHPWVALGLGDGGAHCGVICDAGVATWMLSYWARDRERGEKLPLEWVVKKQTADTAALYGLFDRGLLRPGLKADINVIDFERIGVGLPQVVNDLPANGRRIVQAATGYVATIVNGEVTFRDGVETGARPGALVRGEQHPTMAMAPAK